MKIRYIVAALIIVIFGFIDAHGADQGEDLFVAAETAFVSGKDAEAENGYLALMKTLPKDHPLVPYIRYHLGISQLRQGKSGEAVLNMTPYYLLRPDNPLVVRNYARALLLDKKYREAIDVYEQFASLDERFEAEARYFIGNAKIALGDIPGGEEDLKMAKEWASEPALRTDAEKALADLEKERREMSAMETQAAVVAAPGQPTKEKPWSFSLGVGAEYDSNTALIPSEQTKPEDISSQGDGRLTYSLGGIYEYLNTGRHFAGVNVGIYGTQQFRDTEFSVQNGSLGLYYKGNFADTFQIRLSPYIAKTLLKLASHSWSWGITPGVSWQPVTWTWTDFDYTYSKQTFTDPANYPEENRDGNTQNFNLRQNIALPSLLLKNRNTFFSVSLYHNRYNTDGASAAGHAEGIGLLGQQELPWDLTFQAGYNYTKTNYDNPNIRSEDNDKRSDNSHVVNAYLFKKLDKFMKNLSAYIGYRWYKNDSNIPKYYSYSSNTYTAGLTLDL